MKLLLLPVLICLGLSGVLRADPAITFDDLPSTQVPVPPGYHGLNWVNFDYINSGSYGVVPSGFLAGIVSSSNVVYGIGGETAVMSAGMFDLVSAYATAVWNTNLQFEAKGYIHGTLVYDQIHVLSPTTPTLINFNFYGVDEVDFTASGGGQYSGYHGLGTEFALDNVSVVTYVPYAPLITNGGFETGDFSGWSLGGSTAFTSVTSGSPYVHSGTYGAQMGPTNPAYLSQTVPTQIGEQYLISFWLENPDPGIPNSFGVTWAGQPALGFGFPGFSLTNAPAFSWTNIQLVVPATRTSEDIQFQFLNVNEYFGFDDVSVTPVPLLTNGGFETGTFSGWTPSGNSSRDTVTTAAAAVRSGTYGASFAAQGSLGFITQNIATYPGQPYLVSLWLNSPDGQSPNRFEVLWGNHTLMDQSSLGAFGWTNLHFIAVNSSTKTDLGLGGQDNATALGLDEVSVTPVPILQNGGFEFGDFTGWTTTGNFNLCSVSTNSLYAFAGFYGGQFGPIGVQSFLSQTITTVPGQAYAVRFMLDSPLNESASEFSFAWNTNTLLDITSLQNFGWETFEFLVTASGTTSTVQFGFRDDPNYLGLDEVSVSPVTLPVMQSIVKTNASVNLTWNAMPGYLYQLQYKTNLAQTAWTTLGSEIFPQTIPMTATDTNPPDADRYYRVQMFPPPEIF